jgi:hypothetical protein
MKRINPTLIHPDYKLEPCDGILSETGKLEVLKVVPKSGDGPYFIARWDQRGEHVDIDMHGAPKSAIKKFKANEGGYSGHRTRRTAVQSGRCYKIEIKTPRGMIFQGTVSFANAYVLPVATGRYNIVIGEVGLRAGSKTEGA